VDGKMEFTVYYDYYFNYRFGKYIHSLCNNPDYDLNKIYYTLKRILKKSTQINYFIGLTDNSIVFYDNDSKGFIKNPKIATIHY
jgi:hypothetical protein